MAEVDLQLTWQRVGRWWRWAWKKFLAIMVSGLVPSLIIGGLIFLLAISPSRLNSNVVIATGSATPTGSTLIPLQINLSDLSSGANLLKSMTLNEVQNLYFELIIVYQPEDAEGPNIDTYHNVKIVEALDANGNSLAHFSTNIVSLLMTLDSSDFYEFIQQQASMKHLYLVKQSPSDGPFPSATMAPSGTSTFTPFPVLVGEVAFDLLIDEKLKSDVNQLEPGDAVLVIISKNITTSDGSTPQHQTVIHTATIANILDKNYEILSGPRYTTAEVIRLNISTGEQNQNIQAFANDLSSAIAIYLIKEKTVKQ